MLIIGYSRAFASSINETIWDPSDWFNVRNNGVSASSPAWTIAVAGRAMTDASLQYPVAMNPSSYIRRNGGGANNFRIRWQNTAGTLVATTDNQGNVVNGSLYSVIASIDVATSTAKAYLNGAQIHNQVFADSSKNPLHGPNYMNGTGNSGSAASSINIRAVWIGAGYLDPAIHYGSFFNGDGIPTAAMLSKGAIGGLSPQFAESGNAAAWEAYAIGKSGGFDLEDA